MPVVRVAAAIIGRGEKILICRRGAGGSCAGLWEFPGGKLEPGETPEACVRRECGEELGVRISVGEVYETVRHTYPDREVELVFFRAELLEGEPVCRVHEQILWVPARRLTDYPFCPADEDLVRRLAEEG